MNNFSRRKRGNDWNDDDNDDYQDSDIENERYDEENYDSEYKNGEKLPKIPKYSCGMYTT